MQGICYRRRESKLAKYWNSHLTLTEYCRRNHLNIKTASKWRKRLRPDFVMDVTKTKASLDSLEIVPVLPEEPLASDSAGIYLESGDFRISIQKNFDVPTLQQLLHALEVI